MNTNQVDINKIFEKIDAKLAAENVPVDLRLDVAFGEVSDYFGICLPVRSSAPLPSNEAGNQIAAWLENWYQSMYGQQKTKRFVLGEFSVKIRNDLWLYSIPEYSGKCSFFVNKDLYDKGESYEANVLRMCIEMQQSYINRLTDAEVKYIFKTFNFSRESFEIYSCWSVLELPMYHAATADYENAKVQLHNYNPHYGQARWSYLQCFEKIIKSWLKKTGKTDSELRDIGHSLEESIKKFNQLYSSKISLDLARKIQCSASVRYDEEESNKEQALAAEKAVLQLIHEIGFNPTLCESGHKKITDDCEPPPI